MDDSRPERKNQSKNKHGGAIQSPHNIQITAHIPLGPNPVTHMVLSSSEDGKRIEKNKEQRRSRTHKDERIGGGEGRRVIRKRRKGGPGMGVFIPTTKLRRHHHHHRRRIQSLQNNNRRATSPHKTQRAHARNALHISPPFPHPPRPAAWPGLT
ncbi:hypothetical protein BS50DRAFT_397665 [Corynespora cassiicola Philippines]|uniref:Uncharacterized protein n=1 Tax=Corynespora cassiicola Philippines TaxID=1448308 RepID=A0A2T2NK27_CORCC|nr:hypothetical protein BS50DRAFT_397665 [Corynespora cassiicola Philippines]